MHGQLAIHSVIYRTFIEEMGRLLDVYSLNKMYLVPRPVTPTLDSNFRQIAVKAPKFGCRQQNPVKFEVFVYFQN